MWHQDTPKNRRKGILLISLACFAFASLDSTAKWLLQHMPIVELVWLRFVSQALVSVVLLTPKYGVKIFQVHNWKLQALRALLLGLMTSINFWALQFLQLTETVSIMFSAPLIVALISHYGLKHTLHKGQWVAIVAGFMGVLVIVRPSSGAVHPAIFLMVLNAVLFALFTLLTRKLAQTENAAALQWFSSMGPVLLLAPFALQNFSWPQSHWHWLVLGAIGLAGGLGHYFMARAHQYASSAVLSPFSYQQLLYMAAWGWLLFGDVPPLAVYLGGIIIVLSGIYLLRHEGEGTSKDLLPE